MSSTEHWSPCTHRHIPCAQSHTSHTYKKAGETWKESIMFEERSLLKTKEVYMSARIGETKSVDVFDKKHREGRA